MVVTFKITQPGVLKTDLLCLQMREIIYSRDHRVNRHKFDGVDPVVLYLLNFVCYNVVCTLLLNLCCW